MCGSEPCVACHGPRRRERDRARYLVGQLVASLTDTTTLGLGHDFLDEVDTVDSAITRCRRAYVDYQDHLNDRTAGQRFEAAVRVAGHHIIRIADPLIADRIASQNCARPQVNSAQLSEANARLRTASNDWAQLHATVRRRLRLTDDDGVTEEMLFDPRLSPPELRWRRAVHATYIEARADFLSLSDRAAGRDPGWTERTHIRSRTYLEVIGQLRPLGVREAPHTGDPIDDFPTAWLDELAARVPAPESVTSPVRSADAHHTLVHRVEDAVPAVRRIATLYARRHAANGVAIHSMVGTGVDGRHEAVAVGAEALFGGRFGGLVGDGYRTRDDEHRALVLGTWAAL